MSRNLVPTRILAFDLTARTVTAEFAVPAGAGAWGLAPAGPDAVWIGLFGAPGVDNLYRLDLTTATLEPHAALANNYLWDLAVGDDGVVYVAAGEPYELRSYDPATGSVSTLLAAAPGETMRSVAVAGTTVFVGGSTPGSLAQLRAVDLGDGSVTDVTPPDLVDHGIVYALAVGAGRLVAGTRGPGGRDPAVAALDLEDPGQVEVVLITGETLVDTLEVLDDGVVYATMRTSGGVARVDLSNGTVDRLATPVPFAENRGVFVWRDRLVGAAGNGTVWLVEPDGTGLETLDLVTEGLVEPGPERPQSLAVAAGTAWSGGSFNFQSRSLADGATHRRFIPGEPKDLVVASGVLYLALYPGGEVWSLPTGDTAPAVEGGGDGLAELVQFDPEQTRPYDAVHVPDRNLLLVSTAADFAGGGALQVVDLTARSVDTYVNPIATDQSVAALAVLGHLVFLGGGAATSELVAFDLDTRSEAWRLPEPLPGLITGLTVAGSHLHGFTSTGLHVVVDPAAQQVVHEAQLGTIGGRLITAGGTAYGVDYDTLWRFDPVTFAADAVVTGLASEVFGYPFLAADEDGTLFVIAGTDLARVHRPR